MAEQYSEFLINIIGAFLILILGAIIAEVLSNILKKFIKGSGITNALEKQLKLKIPIEKYTASILKYIIYFATIIIALSRLGIPTKTLKIILIVIVILIIIFIILAFKDWLPNLISGIYLIKTKKLKPKDIIKINDIEGKVISIKLLETQIETNNKEIIFIPNSNLTKYKVIKKKNGKGIHNN
ncbi:mechanosensitive ion channel [Candidatus Woesearchaeota archaeon]|nr:mechanosensitive ion channel [Candidatus Woesearchaeota archaeon]